MEVFKTTIAVCTCNEIIHEAIEGSRAHRRICFFLEHAVKCCSLAIHYLMFAIKEHGALKGIVRTLES